GLVVAARLRRRPDQLVAEVQPVALAVVAPEGAEVDHGAADAALVQVGVRLAVVASGPAGDLPEVVYVVSVTVLGAPLVGNLADLVAALPHDRDGVLFLEIVGRDTGADDLAQAVDAPGVAASLAVPERAQVLHAVDLVPDEGVRPFAGGRHADD